MVKRNRPKIVEGTTTKVPTGCGNLYITVNSDKEGPLEIFSVLGRAGGCAHCQLEAISRLASLLLKYGISIEEVQAELVGLRCPAPSWLEGQAILSCPDALAKILNGNKESSYNST
jgi:ribonucleoside-diphosphate reductase alpha chain